ncbi:MAG: (2Fe-2S)-binding protein [Acidobacteria bacterium]|nr:(2Fe-2S)-binding protein [Acidobacteriota bacterium]
MPRLKINDVELEAPAGALVLDLCREQGIDIPHYCYHPALSPVATCRMCLVELKGQPKLATSCTTTVPPAPRDNPEAVVMEVLTNSPAVADARASVMDFLLMNHPLDCPICDQAGECKLQDYSYAYGSGDSKMVEPKRRYRYEDLGAKIVIDKNRCIHCTRCVRFTKEVTGTYELTVAQRGSHLEVTTYSGKSLDGNPWAGNVVDLCPVGALTSRDFRFNKRVWYLKPVPSISRYSATASPVWLDVDQNRVWRIRPRPLPGHPETFFLHDEERYAYHSYNLDPSRRLEGPRLKGERASFDRIREALEGAGPVAVVGQGTFGNESAERLGSLATEESWRFGTGDKHYPILLPKHQLSADGIFNRRGFSERGFRFGLLEILQGLLEAGTVKGLVILHDEAFSSGRESERLLGLVGRAAFSLVLECLPSELGRAATATVPITTCAEESDAVTNHQGEIRRYERALQPPMGICTVAQVVNELKGVPVPA